MHIKEYNPWWRRFGKVGTDGREWKMIADLL
jgi:hypothetical protein